MTSTSPSRKSKLGEDRRTAAPHSVTSKGGRAPGKRPDAPSVSCTVVPDSSTQVVECGSASRLLHKLTCTRVALISGARMHQHTQGMRFKLYNTYAFLFLPPSRRARTAAAPAPLRARAHPLVLSMSSSTAPSQRGQHHFKLVLLGNSGVGKSSLVLRFVKNEFIEDMETTIGAAFLTKTLALDDCSVKLEVRSPPCQRRFAALGKVLPSHFSPVSLSLHLHAGTHTRAQPQRSGTLRGRSGTAPWRQCTTAARRRPL